MNTEHSEVEEEESLVHLSRSQAGCKLLQLLVVRNTALTNHQLATHTGTLPGDVRYVQLQL